MNKSFRVIFNHATGVYQCVSEFAKAKGKSKSVKALAVAVGLLMGGASFGADLEFSDGTTTTVETAGINGDVIITNPNTKIIATKQVLFGTSTGSPPKTTNATISNQATVQGTEATALGDSHDATVTVDNAILTAGELLALGIKTNRVAKLIGKNGATIAVAGRTSIGNEVGATGEIELDGANTTLTVTPNTNSVSVIRVGERGVGSLTAKNQASITADKVSVGDNATSTGTLTLDNAKLSSKDLGVGLLGKGTLAANKGIINLTSTLSVGDNTGSVGVATLSDTNLTATDLIAIGAKGTGTLTFNDTATSYNPANTTKINTSKLIVGQFTGGTGTMTVNGASPLQVTGSMIVGGGGTGTLTINKNSEYGVGHTYVIGTVYLGGSPDTNPETQNGTGTLILKDSALRADEVVVGNSGKGVLRLEAGNADDYLTGLYVNQISRNTNSAQSDIYVNGAEIGIRADQANLFANFTNANKIEIGNKGVIFETETTDSRGRTIATNAVINPNAVLTGNVGTVNLNNLEQLAGFVKAGQGTLEISESSKKFTGDIVVAQGTLKINGNYAMNGESLVIGIFDNDENRNIDPTNEYGKLVVTGTADISNGNLKVATERLIKDTPQDSTFKDVVTAGTLNGQFKSVADNSPLVDFEADYTDANKVHLKLKAQNTTPTPPVTPPTTPPTNPTTPPVAPPVTPPTPPTPSSNAFVTAVTGVKRNNLTQLAQVLDKAVDDRVAGNANTLANALITDTTNQTQAELADFATKLQPLLAGSANRLIVDGSRTVAGVLDTHTPDPKKTVWTKALHTQGSLDKTDSGLTGFDDKHTGIVVGADTAFGKSNIGLALAYGQHDTDSRGYVSHKLTARTAQALIYGIHQADARTTLKGYAGVGQSTLDGSRHIHQTAIAKSDYKADLINAGLSIHYQIGTENRHLSPFAKVDFAQAKSDSYNETGAGAYNLTVNGDTYKSLISTAGVKGRIGSPTLGLTSVLAVGVDNGSARSVLNGAFIGTESSTFSLTGHDIGRTISTAGLGVAYTPNVSTKVSLDYQGNWRKHYDNQGVILSFEKKF